MRINNSRVVDLPMDEEAQRATVAALAGADDKLVSEAYCHAPESGTPDDFLGLHHEVLDGDLVVNRDALYSCIQGVREDGSQQPAAAPAYASSGPTAYAALGRLPRAARIGALEHIQRHMKALRDT